MEFVMWYYYLMDLSKTLKVATSGFRNFLLEYKDQPFVYKYVNCEARKHVSITALPKRVVPPPM